MTSYEFEVVGPYAISVMVSIGAMCVFIWAVLSGAFNGSDDAAVRFYHREVDDDGHAAQ